MNLNDIDFIKKHEVQLNDYSNDLISKALLELLVLFDKEHMDNKKIYIGMEWLIEVIVDVSYKLTNIDILTFLPQLICVKEMIVLYLEKNEVNNNELQCLMSSALILAHKTFGSDDQEPAEFLNINDLQTYTKKACTTKQIADFEVKLATFFSFQQCHDIFQKYNKKELNEYEDILKKFNKLLDSKKGGKKVKVSRLKSKSKKKAKGKA